MKLTQKKAGLALVAVAVAVLGSAAIADNAGHGGGGRDMMMGPPMLNFDTVDANKDGKITPDELTAARAAQVKSVDSNGDGKLSVDELAAMRLKAMTEAAEAMAQKMVDRLDTDGDKMLSAAELISAPLPPDLFAMVDTNKDGAIDKAEADAAQKMMMDHGPRDGHGKHGGHGTPDDQNGNGQNGDGQNGNDQNGTGDGGN